MIQLVPEMPAHAPARERLLDVALGAGRRRKTSEKLRHHRLPAQHLSFAAMDGTRLVGTVRLWHVEAGEGRAALLLGPLAVAADRRGEGVGARLMNHAIETARVLGHEAILLVGDAPYYARFGFTAALTADLRLPGPVDPARFLGLELRPGALAGASGLVAATGVLRRPARVTAACRDEAAAA